MRILITGDVVGGVRTFVLQLARYLAKQGDEVHLALVGDEVVPDVARELEDSGAASWAIRPLKLEWMQDPWDDVEETARWVEALVRDLAPDIVHLNTFAPVQVPVPTLLTLHSCVLSWWRHVERAGAPAAWARYRDVVRSALGAADGVTAVSAALLRDMQEIYGAPHDASVIHNGSDAGPPGPLTPNEEREALIFSAGRVWDKAKNASLTAAAAGQVDARFVMAGGGALGGVEALGRITHPEVLRWMARAAIFVEPARYEPFGLAALEAARCGCALVLGDIASLREVWGDAARYVDPDNADALAQVLRELLDDPAERALLADKAKDRAQRYSTAAMGAAYRRSFTRLAVAAHAEAR